ncbi:hypothetical protein Tco_0729023 [Tanacetum coccineum]|uniref:Uncharacterized protein n=1 Tax=Tanacetum coccineum TaxID=301880 RepID=A0ABQ4YNN2_9ASTR
MTNVVPAPPTDPPKILDGSRGWGIRIVTEIRIMEIFRSRVRVKIRVMEETMRTFGDKWKREEGGFVGELNGDSFSTLSNNSYASEAIDYVNNINIDVNVVVQKWNACASKVMENAVDEITNVSSTMNNAKNDIIMNRNTVVSCWYGRNVTGTPVG